LKLARPNPQMQGQEEILKQVAEKNESEQARGLATFALGCYNRMMAQQNEANAAKQAQYLAEAEKYLAKVKSDYSSVAAVPYLRTTVGAKTDSELNRLRNMANLKVGGVAPEIDAVDIDGNPLKLSDSRGKVTVLIFWGSWCGPCMSLVPHEKELYERMKGKPFELISVNCGDTQEKAQATRKDKEMGWRCWWDGGTTDGPIQATYNVPHYPRIFVIDAKGVIRNIDVRHKALDEAVDKLIEEMNSGKI
jgi:thiol-disulfide isomerase/thioredoxin